MSVQQKKKEQVDNFCCRRIAVGCKNLTDLRLSNCKYVSDVGMVNIALCPKLEAVRLTNVPCVSGKGLLSLVSACLSLRLRHITELNNVKDTEWLEFIGNWRQIESLGMWMCRGFEETQLGKLGPRGWRNLREIMFCGDLLVCRRNPLSQLRGWRFADPEGTQYCPNLEVVKFAFCLSMSTTGLWWMLARCQALRQVELYLCHGVEDEDICLFAKNNPQVSSLVFKVCGHLPAPSLTNLSLIHIAENLCDLKLLNLGCTPKGGFMPESESGIVAIVESCTRLRMLGLTDIPFIGGRTMTAIGRSPSLTQVTFSGIAHLNDEMILLIGPNLTVLRLTGCPHLTDECLDNFRLPHGPLVYLGIKDCPSITRRAAGEATVVLLLE